MASAYNVILKAILLFCCFCNAVRSDSRDSYNDRLRGIGITCPTDGNASISFRNNVNLLLSDFNQQSSIRSYYNTSIGDSPDRVYGYYMCRADVGLQVCSSCILNGTQFSMELSCEKVTAFFDSELCIFRYANYSMYGQWESTTSVSDFIEANVSNYQQFNQTLSSTLEEVIDEAAFGRQNNGSILGFATQEANVTRDETIYSLAQCTPDILGMNCSLCLRSARSWLRNGTPAAFATMNKCHLRYDNISFYNLEKPNVNIGAGLRSLNNRLAVYSVVFLIVYNFFFSRT